MARDPYYPLSPGVKVRREAFGLLFYSHQDARLTFIHSGDLLQLVPGADGKGRLQVVSCADGDEGRQLQRLLETLLRKGLILETRVCP